MNILSNSSLSFHDLNQVCVHSSLLSNKHIKHIDMCETYTFYHLCGHIQTTKTLKCLGRIQNQLQPICYDENDEACPSPESMSLVDPDFPDQCVDIPEIILNPTLCEGCDKVELLSNYICTQPCRKYEIIKEWSKNKKVAKQRMSTIFESDDGESD